MKPQTNANHARFVPGYHFVMTLLLLIGLVVSIFNLFAYKHENILETLMFPLIFICCFLIGYFARTFAIKAQDRAIRAEEHLRYFILTGKAMDKRLTLGQIIALRFAGDDEFAGLADQAVAGNLSPKEIKQMVANWREDTHRV